MHVQNLYTAQDHGKSIDCHEVSATMAVGNCSRASGGIRTEELE